MDERRRRMDDFQQQVLFKEDQLEEELELFDEYIRAESFLDSRAICHTAEEFAKSLHDTGTGAIAAQETLAKLGFPALGSQQGIAWLQEKFPAE